MATISPYKALALQVTCKAINSLDKVEAKKQMLETIANIGLQIKASKAFIGQDLQLVVLPEYFLTGFPMGETIEEWKEKACISNGDEVYKAIQQIAIDNNIFLSGNVYENDIHFPNLYFQACFIINPNGEEILKYRRVNSMFAPTPHDVLDKYIEVYGEKSLFPVVKTSIGNLACIASEEILYPEIARCLAFNGAEVFLHNTSEIASNLSSQKNIAKLARAIENMAYVVSANSASIVGYSIPAASTDAHSQIINYEGIKLCETLCGESMVANATIHIDALRHHRNRPGMSNFLSRQRLELFAPFYTQSIYPANSLINKDANRNHFIEQQRKTITLLKNKGIVE
ncbi:MAG: nitrilase-related carbon-nitrogen hydrolase [Chitinophagaceae bacterium]